MSEQKVLNFELTAAESNVILSALGELPAKQVLGLITKMQQQAAPQFSQTREEAPVPQEPQVLTE